MIPDPGASSPAPAALPTPTPAPHPRPEPLPPPSSHANADEIALLRGQVDALQIEATKRSRPWYRTPSDVMSVVALTISTLFSLLALRHQYMERADAAVAAQVALLRQEIASLAQLQTEWEEVAERTANNVSLQARLNSAFNARRQLLIEDIDRLIDAVGAHVPSMYFVLFGQQLALDANGSRAAEVLARGLAGARGSLARSNVHRSIAMNALQPGDPDTAAGRIAWRAALMDLDGRADAYARYLRTDDLRVWSTQERDLGNAKLADSLLIAARRELDLLPAGSPLRAQLERLLQAGSPPAPISPIASASAQLVGRWRLRLPGGARALLTVDPVGPTGTSPVQILVFADDRVDEIRTGLAGASNGSSLSIWWSAQREASARGGLRAPGAGLMHLRLNGINGLVGDDGPLGSPLVRIVGTRVR
ncbi:MAG: hypothetical protein HY275_05780 [Gemmatimonadetes bacterium]|nr:hypothetical protein [Gemmatimonadota bacterium]